MIRWLTWLCLLLNLQALTGCSGAPKLPDVADKVGAASRLVVPMSRDALTLIQVERDRLVAEKLLTGDTLVQFDAALAKTNGVLQRVERSEKVTRAELLDAIDTATWLNNTIVGLGGKPPPLVASAIDVARRVVGEAE